METLKVTRAVHLIVFYFSTFVLLVFLSYPNLSKEARAEVINIGKEYIDVEPLAQSKWFAEHPDSLPYSRCFFRSNFFLPQEARDWGLIYTKDYLSSITPSHFLVCYTRSLRLAFVLPMQMGSRTRWGLILPFMYLNQRIEEEIELVNLNGKTVREIVGHYRGIGATVPWTNYFSIQNPKGVKLRILGINPNMEFSLSSFHMNLSLPPTLRRTDCAWNPLYPFSDQCWDSARNPQLNYSIDQNQLLKMQFVEIQEQRHRKVPGEKAEAKAETLRILLYQDEIFRTSQNGAMNRQPVFPYVRHLHLYALLGSHRETVRRYFHRESVMQDASWHQYLSEDEIKSACDWASGREAASDSDCICSICLEPLLEESGEPNEPCIQLECHEKLPDGTKRGHVFHHSCATKWLNTLNGGGQELTCPVCRGRVDYKMTSYWRLKRNFNHQNP